MAQPGSALRELASRIYVEVLGRSITATNGKLEPGVDPLALAALSVKLAEIFLKAEDQAANERLPTTAFELDAGNLAQWSTPAATPAK